MFECLIKKLKHKSIWNVFQRIKWDEESLQIRVEGGVNVEHSAIEHSSFPHAAFLPIGDKKIHNFTFGNIFKKITQNGISRNNSYNF